KFNQKNRRTTAKYFYLLGGMVFCEKCQRIYTAQTKLPDNKRRRHADSGYRHRTSEGHCQNRYLSARKVERQVWEEVVKVLMNPSHLRDGYQKWSENQEAEVARQQEHLTTLQESITKLEAKRDNLTKAYIDP